MKTSPAGLRFIAGHEGLRLNAYLDPVGVWTIGIGHTSAAGPPAVRSGLRITEAEAYEILARDIAKFEAAVRRQCTHLHPLNQNEFDALVSFAFNLGEGNLKQLVQGRNRATIAKKIPLYNKAGGRVLRGLTRRRGEERALFLTPAAAPVTDAPKPVEPPKASGGLLAAIISIIARIFGRKA